MLKNPSAGRRFTGFTLGLLVITLATQINGNTPLILTAHNGTQDSSTPTPSPTPAPTTMTLKSAVNGGAFNDHGQTNPLQVNKGDVIDYQIVISGDSSQTPPPGTSSGFILSAQIPASTTYNNDCNPSCTSTGSIVWALNGPGTFTYSVTVATNVCGFQFTNLAVGSGNGQSINSSTQFAQINSCPSPTPIPPPTPLPTNPPSQASLAATVPSSTPTPALIGGTDTTNTTPTPKAEGSIKLVEDPGNLPSLQVLDAASTVALHGINVTPVLVALDLLAMASFGFYLRRRRVTDAEL